MNFFITFYTLNILKETYTAFALNWAIAKKSKENKAVDFMIVLCFCQINLPPSPSFVQTFQTKWSQDKKQELLFWSLPYTVTINVLIE